MRIDSYHGPVNEAFAAEVATLVKSSSPGAAALDIARALNNTLVACMWYENGVRRLEAIGTALCVHTLTGEKHCRINELHVSASVTAAHMRELVQFLINQGIRWGAVQIMVDVHMAEVGVDRVSLQKLCSISLEQHQAFTATL